MQVADIGGGSLHLVIGLLAAVIRRSQTGEGAQVDISMHDGALAWNIFGLTQQLVGGETLTPESHSLNGGSFYDIYETKDGRFLSVGALEPKFWQGFCQAIGREDLFVPGLNFEVTNQQRFKAEIRQVIQSQPLAHWRDLFAQLDVCVEPVLTSEEAIHHPQTQARNMIIEVPTGNGRSQQQVASPIKLSDHTPAYGFSGVPLGQHGREILQQLGYAYDEIQALYAQDVVAG